MSLSGDVDLEEFVMAKDDMSGADIKAVCTEAGLLALRERRMRVTKADFTAAREKVCLPRCAITVDSDWCGVCRCSIGRMRARPRDCIYNESAAVILSVDPDVMAVFSVTVIAREFIMIDHLMAKTPIPEQPI
jgi:hypothetical protein